MTDRELLELTAKAAGYEVELTSPYEAKIDGEWQEWNPLEYDSHALRLAVKLTLEIDVCHTGIAVRTPDGIKVLVDSKEQPDAYAATRQAIVRAAAEIGKAMP